MKNLFLVFVAIMVSNFSFSQTKDVVDIAIGSADHTTLVAAVKAADLVTTLKSAGPFTVFAPTNAAFDKLPAGTVADLLKPENKAQLAKILTYHVVAGNMDAAAVTKAIKAGKGKAIVTTVSGGQLTVSMDKEKVKLTDESGNSAFVTVADLKGSNGVVHVIDSVLLPK
ncbi:MAG: fasciclin domain-containing protein [Cyclobacteriaceae bacterium]|nr:fasciclin domain-containing protein [Cyclobacteriaceae bacterium]